MKKSLKEVKFTLHNEEVLTVKDSLDSNAASAALDEFLAEKIAKLVIDEKIVYVPFHAVIKVEVTMSTEEVDDPKDANCNKECDC